MITITSWNLQHLLHAPIWGGRYHPPITLFESALVRNVPSVKSVFYTNNYIFSNIPLLTLAFSIQYTYIIQYNTQPLRIKIFYCRANLFVYFSPARARKERPMEGRL